MLVSELKLFLPFKKFAKKPMASLNEKVSQSEMIVVGRDFEYVEDLEGYSMKDDQYLFGSGVSNGYSTGISDKMTIGFWLYSYNAGIAVNDGDGATSPIKMPLLDFVNPSDLLDSIFSITERTTETGYNRILLKMGGYEAYSEEFRTSQWNYIWISYTGSTISMYINGKSQTLQDVVSSPPASISGANMSLYINHNIDGYEWNISKNKGVIDDIFLMDASYSDESDVQRVINDGIEYFVNDIYTEDLFHKKSIFFNDPETITINSLIDDMNYVFVGRNDGKILKGSPLLWECRHSFSDIKEINKLGLDSSYQQDGCLKISDKTVRL
jgi:hypothetical protein